jgi:sugar lactone lactonase YvrE
MKIATLFVILLSAGQIYGQSNPYRPLDKWAQLPAGRTLGSTSAVDIDPRTGNIWVADRCGANSCFGSTLDPIFEFDPSGKLLKNFGAGMFVLPHGIFVDKDGNVWIVDEVAKEGKGNVVVKFSPDGLPLMTLGRPGLKGASVNLFNSPSDVAVAPNGDIFVADGHGGDTNARIMKFAGDGKLIKVWGHKGSGPGEFDTPHALAFDSKGRLFVGDRSNNRIQIFDQDGHYLDEWKQFGAPSGIFIDAKDNIYVTDSQSNSKTNPGFKRGIRVGNVKDGKVTAFIPDTQPNPDSDDKYANNSGTVISNTSGAEGVVADAKGNIYGAEVGPQKLTKYVLAQK